MIAELVNLLLPECCPSCGRILVNNERFICTRCHYQLPRTGFGNMRDNPVARLFWGRVNLCYATSLYHYTKGGSLQNIMHRLKYQGQKWIGTELGILLGISLGRSCYKEVDLIVPVPLHREKQKQRGFNQSELIASGVSAVMNKPLNTGSFKRISSTGTQTSKSRYDRLKNVRGIFRIQDEVFFRNKHILLIDDVITTGATLEACAEEFLDIKGARVSVASVGVADLLQ